jgi:hypothetical protein
MKYTIWIVSPYNYEHSHAFDEVAQSLNESLISLSHESQIITYAPPIGIEGKVIILGGNLLANWPTHIERSWIVYNLEQITPGSPWLTYQYIDLLKTNPVWDYSLENIAELSKLGIQAKYLAIGYSPCLTRIVSSTQDIDVLHYGSMTERRLNIINELAAKGLNVHAAFGVYGAKRDALIANAKVILNVHFYESKVFEIVRCSYLMANTKCVVSEPGSGGESYDGGICFAPYESLVQHCLDLCGDGKERERIAWKGYEIFSSKSQAEYLKAVL